MISNKFYKHYLFFAQNLIYTLYYQTTNTQPNLHDVVEMLVFKIEFHTTQELYNVGECANKTQKFSDRQHNRPNLMIPPVRICRKLSTGLSVCSGLN